MKLPFPLRDKTEWILLGPLGPELSPLLVGQHPIMAVDGGANWTQKADIWIGDGDSSSKRLGPETVSFLLPAQKDQSDLALALTLLENPAPLRLHLWGFSGGRKDHELFVLGECLHFLNQRPQSEMLLYDSQGHKLFQLLGPGHWDIQLQGIFSLGTLTHSQVQLTGACAYPLSPAQRLDPLSSRGLSNVGHGHCQLRTDAPVFLYFPESA